MQKILLTTKNGHLTIPSEYNKLKVKQWVKDGVTLFELTPRVRGSRKQQQFLEAAVVPAWAHFQYDIDPRDPSKRELARTLFKQDWNYTVVKDKSGNPRRVAQSLKNRHREVLDRYMNEAPENGFPMPNNELYLMWRDQFSMEPKYADYYDWLDALNLDVDSMPSKETLEEFVKQHEKTSNNNI